MSDSISTAVKAMKPRRYTVTEAAEKIGKSPDTLKRWRVTGVFVPSDSRTFGKVVVPLYTADDIKEMRKIAKTMRPGRKKKTDA